MDEVRLINATPLEKEMQEYALYIGRETTNECESTAECCADMVSEAPTIDPETLRPTAHIVHGTVPETEDGVFCSRCRGFIGMETSYIAEHAAFCWHCGAKMEE